MIKVEIIADSVSTKGKRITTVRLTYPRFIHSEVMTHRDFSRNASSSRAIPVIKNILAVWHNMAIPIHLGANRKGMQATEEVSEWKKLLVRSIWKGMGYTACAAAWVLDKIGVHKQVANRILEPWNHITVVITSTEWANFFALRYHKDAQPEFQEVAKQLWLEMQNNKPATLKPGQWHLPFITKEDFTFVMIDFQAHDIDLAYGTLLKVSAARCARVSYFNQDGRTPSREEDLKLYERLANHRPMHASPLEHQARAAVDPEQRSGNFVGWMQFRKMLPNENVKEFNGPGL